MVRLTTVLARVPVIRFRAGGGGGPAAAAAPPAAAAAPAAAPAASPAAAAAPARAAAPAGCPFKPAKAMSTSAIPDLDLPVRYQRTPLSEEEIDHINGGGIV